MLCRTVTILAFILLPFLLTAQVSHHGLSLRLGIGSPPNMEVAAPAGGIVSANFRNSAGLTGSARYDYYFNDRWSASLGVGVTLVSNRSTVIVSGPTLGNADEFFGPRLTNSTSYWELGITYAQPLLYRLSLVGEVGGLLLKVDSGGGSGRTSVIEPSTDEAILSSAFEYQFNPDQKTNPALQLALGLRCQLTDNFYLTLRGSYVTSGARLVENGRFSGSSRSQPEPTIVTFEQKYGLLGIDIMGSYRF